MEEMGEGDEIPHAEYTIKWGVLFTPGAQDAPQRMEKEQGRERDGGSHVMLEGGHQGEKSLVAR